MDAVYFDDIVRGFNQSHNLELNMIFWTFPNPISHDIMCDRRETYRLRAMNICLYIMRLRAFRSEYDIVSCGRVISS